jgi:hypothetical protein
VQVRRQLKSQQQKLSHISFLIPRILSLLFRTSLARKLYLNLTNAFRAPVILEQKCLIRVHAMQEPKVLSMPATL